MFLMNGNNFEVTYRDKKNAKTLQKIFLIM